MNNPSDLTSVVYTDLPTVETFDQATHHSITYGLPNLPEAFRSWVVVAKDPRIITYFDDDSEALDGTNWAAVVDRVCGDEPELISEHYPGEPFFTPERQAADALTAGYCLLEGASYNRVLVIDPTDEDRMSAAREVVDDIESYILLDEDAYSALEWEAWERYAPGALRDEVRDAERDGTVDEETSEWLADNGERLLPELAKHLHYESGFSGEYGPPFLAIFEDLGGRPHFEAKWQHEDQELAGQTKLAV